MSASKSRTTELLLRWNEGDAGALQSLLEKHMEWIRATVTRQLGPELRSKLETGDLVQEAMLDFLQYGPRIKPANGGQFRAVVSAIVINALRDRYAWFRAKRRDMARETSLSRDTAIDLARDVAGDPAPDEQAAQAELEVRIRLVLELMPPAFRQVVILRDWESRSFVDIAAELHLTADAARMRYKRGLARLRAGLEALRAGAVEQLLSSAD
jgi:RNA polymerase sigma-70 factor (ECF subfamily)